MAQVGVLSTTLFSIKINDIVKCLGILTDCSLYVDDFCVCFRSKIMGMIERQLQLNLNKIENLATYNGFKALTVTSQVKIRLWLY